MNEELIHEKWMRRCLQLAAYGRENARPNPMVGAVAVVGDRIVGEGYHIRAGEAHAEVNAIAMVEKKNPKLLKVCTLYVSLEPCSHYGKTPPCAELIIRKQIPRVVVGCEDPFAKVSGRGIEMLRAAGVEVTVGVLLESCRELNRTFITFHTLHRPYVTLKWAETADGKVDRMRSVGDGKIPLQISTPLTQLRVHRLRAENDAIVVGKNTWLKDRPKLTLRHWPGRQPLPFVLGNTEGEALPKGFRRARNIDDLFAQLYDLGCQSLLVEGGPETLRTFIESGLWDEAWAETSPQVLGEGVEAPVIPAAHAAENFTFFGRNYRHWRNRHE